MKKIAMFDLDGVLADDRHRVHYALNLEWFKYFDPANVAADPVWSQGERLLFMMQSLGWEIGYMTGRRESLRKTTTEWLEANGFPEGTLYMRGPGFLHQRLAEVKALWLRDFQDTSAVVLFDDDPEVVAEVRRQYGYGAARHCTWHIKEKALVKKATS